MRVSDVLRAVEAIYSPLLAMPDDNIGLQVGDPDTRVHTVLTALDADPDAVREAVRIGAELIVSHHPIWWKAPRQLSCGHAVGAGARAALASGIAVINAHTNADFADAGLCDAMARKLKLTAPEAIRRIGDAPVGRIGDAPPMSWSRWLALVRRLWGANVRWAGRAPRVVCRVAVCSGSGADLLQEAFDRKADVLVTGDVKYHAARDAEYLGDYRRETCVGAGFVVVDAGHFETERCFANLTARALAARLPKLKICAHAARPVFRRS